MDVIDEQIDTVGKAMLGMSLGCARCHDHKFDPIPTSDYYALAGIFHSTAVQSKSIETPAFTQAREGDGLLFFGLSIENNASTDDEVAVLSIHLRDLADHRRANVGRRVFDAMPLDL